MAEDIYPDAAAMTSQDGQRLIWEKRGTDYCAESGRDIYLAYESPDGSPPGWRANYYQFTPDGVSWWRVAQGLPSAWHAQWVCFTVSRAI